VSTFMRTLHFIVGLPDAITSICFCRRLNIMRLVREPRAMPSSNILYVLLVKESHIRPDDKLMTKKMLFFNIFSLL
jgi:hypothetical protein